MEPKVVERGFPERPADLRNARGLQRWKDSGQHPGEVG